MNLIHYKSIVFAVACWAALLITDRADAQVLPCPPMQTQRLMPACEDRGTFGESLSLLNNRLAIGRFDTSRGRVATYTRNPDTRLWEFESHIRPNGLSFPDSFSEGLELRFDAASNQWLLAAGNSTSSDSAPFAGKAYVYMLDAQGGWVQQAEVVPDVAVENGLFGIELAWATGGERTFLVVGAPGGWGDRLLGSAYVFEQDIQGLWRERTNLQAPDGASDNAFGSALDAAESQGVTVLAIGAWGQDIFRVLSGKVYFYRFDNLSETWVLEAQFEAPDPVEQDHFGRDVSVTPLFDLPGFTHRAAVGRPNEGGNGLDVGPGAVYLYLRTIDGDWLQEAHIQPPFLNGDPGMFGRAVDFDREDPDRLLIGAVNSRAFGPESGGAYIYQRDLVSGEWLPMQGLWGREQDGFDAFAVDLALGNGDSADMAVVGALATQCPGGSQFDAVGAVYSFDLDPGENGECPAPVLTLQKVPDCFSGPGGEIEVRWFQATPDRRARIALLFGRRTGNFIIPDGNPCAGTRLGLGSLDLQVAYLGSAGAFGAGRLVTNVPRAVCGAHLQLIDIARCKTSNVVRIE